MGRKCGLLMLAVCFAILVCACRYAEPQPSQPSQAVSTVPGTSLPQATTVTEFPDETTAPETTEPATISHSPLYVDGVEVEDVIRYFAEVCLDAEFVNSGDPSRLQKWAGPIYYTVEGQPTDDDLAVLEGFASWLNAVEGFPGITRSENALMTNLRIYFCDQTELLDRMGDRFSDVDGAVTFWYSDDVIYDAIICYRTDVAQDVRNSVILEEIYNGLGPVQDTTLRPDSVIYSGFSQPQQLSRVDELILKLLYHPRMRCGMTAAECEAVIREIYY